MPSVTTCPSTLFGRRNCAGEIFAGICNGQISRWQFVMYSFSNYPYVRMIESIIALNCQAWYLFVWVMTTGPDRTKKDSASLKVCHVAWTQSTQSAKGTKPHRTKKQSAQRFQAMTLLNIHEQLRLFKLHFAKRRARLMSGPLNIRFSEASATNQSTKSKTIPYAMKYVNLLALPQ